MIIDGFIGHHPRLLALEVHPGSAGAGLIICFIERCAADTDVGLAGTTLRLLLGEHKHVNG